MINYKKMSLTIFSSDAIMINILFLLANIGTLPHFITFLMQYLELLNVAICIFFLFIAILSFMIALFAIVAGYTRATIIGISLFFLFANFPLIIVGYDVLGLAGVINVIISVLIAVISTRRELFISLFPIITVLLLFSYFLVAIWLTPRNLPLDAFLSALFVSSVFQVFKIAPSFIPFGGVFALITLFSLVAISFGGIQARHLKHSKVSHVMTLFALMFSLLGLGFHALSGIPILANFLSATIGVQSEILSRFLMLLNLLCLVGSLGMTAFVWTMYEVTPPPKKKRIKKAKPKKKEIEKIAEEAPEEELLELELEEL